MGNPPTFYFSWEWGVWGKDCEGSDISEERMAEIDEINTYFVDMKTILLEP